MTGLKHGQEPMVKSEKKKKEGEGLKNREREYEYVCLYMEIGWVCLL